MYRIGEILTPGERLEAMRLGGIKKLASMGLKPSDMDAMVKTSWSTDRLGLLAAALRTSVMIGAPIGAIWYALDSGIREDSDKTRRLKETLDHYNDTVADNRNRLTAVQGE